MSCLNKDIVADLDSYAYDEDVIRVITKLENKFNEDELYYLSEAACQEGACKELVFWVIPFLSKLSDMVKDADKIHIYIEAGMLYAYCYEIEDRISLEMRDKLNLAVANLQKKSIDYYLMNKHNIMDEYYLIGAILTFYHQKFGASILYGNLFAYESELELEMHCPQQHEINVLITNDGIGGKRYKPVNTGKGDEVLWLVRKWKRQRTKQDLLLLLNRTLLKYNMQELNCFDELSNREAQDLFVVLGTMLGYAGYVSEALKYYLMMEPISCSACREDYFLADLWNY